MSEPARPDPEKLRDYARHVFGMMSGATVAGMIHLGDRLGLYRAMAGAGPLDAKALAERTGLSERWVREWLYTQGAGGVLEFRGDDRFELPPEGHAVLVDDHHPANGAGFFAQLPHMMGLLERLPEAFRSGQGLPYDALGSEGARGVERGFAPWFRTLLVPMAIPRLDGVQEALESGIRVADVGCGAGVACVELARAFPRSEVHGYDISSHALARAEENKKEAGLENLHFHDASRDPLPQDQSVGFITAFDCLHDMTHPADVVHAIGRAIAPDGTWLVADIKAMPSYEQNVAKNPMAAMMYGFSVMVCMSSSLSEPGGAGLGTLGLHAELLEQMARDAGFTRFEPIDFGHPVNAFYVIRP